MYAVYITCLPESEFELIVVLPKGPCTVPPPGRCDAPETCRGTGTERGAQGVQARYPDCSRRLIGRQGPSFSAWIAPSRSWSGFPTTC